MTHAEFVLIVRKQIQSGFNSFNITTVTVDDIIIRMDLNGKSAIAMAGFKRNGINREYYLRFNIQALVINLQDLIDNVIPHEIAHLICYIRPELGNRHNIGWKHVCRQLGGTGNRVASKGDYDGLQSAKKSTKFEYMVEGKLYPLSKKYHEAVQNNHIITVPGQQSRTRTRILPSMFISKKVTIPVPLVQRVPVQTHTFPSQNNTSQQLVAPTIKDTNTSKLSRATTIYRSNLNMSRTEIINMFMDDLDISKAGASTYYQKIKSGKLVVFS